MQLLAISLLCATSYANGGSAPDGFECNAGSCFAPREDPFLGQMVSTRPALRTQVVESLQSNFRADTEDRLQLLMTEMRPTYTALPKTEFGTLDDETVRHLLHRHFLRTRAWIVRGLAPDGGHWDRAGTLALLKESAPAGVTELFAQRLGGRGLELREVALLAAMLENQVHQDTIGRLRLAWIASVGDNRTTTTLSGSRKVLDAYMMSYVYTNGRQYLKKNMVDRALSMVNKILPEWDKTQGFVRATLSHTVVAGAKEVSFADLERTVVLITERYGGFQTKSCSDLKHMLLENEGPQPGLVPLGGFYKKTVTEGAYQFSESVAYMRHAGVLAESKEGPPSVIVANYLDCPSQLVASSKDYAVACKDECEPILSRLEEKLLTPYALPEMLEKLVADISTETQPAREDGLPIDLRDKLAEVATANGGEVPIHGRLFSVWLHHAFPRECPYPHGAGFTVNPMLPEDYEAMKGKEGSSSESNATMWEWYNEYAEAKKAGRQVAGAESNLLWDNKEELLTPRVEPRSQGLGATLQMATGFTALAMLLPNIAMVEWLWSAVYTLFHRKSEVAVMRVI